MGAAIHTTYDTSGPRVARRELEAFAGQLLEAVGMDPAGAALTARTLVHADLRGVHSHGVRMLPLYLRTLANKSLNPRPTVREVSSGPGHATFDGDNGMGQVASEIAMARAIELAHEFGVGMTVVDNTGHFGAAGYWVIMAAEAGCMGYCASNLRGPVLLATGGRGGAAGNNPLAWAFPGRRHRPTVLDMATGAVALGKIAALGEGGFPSPGRRRGGCRGPAHPRSGQGGLRGAGGGPQGLCAGRGARRDDRGADRRRIGIAKGAAGARRTAGRRTCSSRPWTSRRSCRWRTSPPPWTRRPTR